MVVVGVNFQRNLLFEGLNGHLMELGRILTQTLNHGPHLLFDRVEQHHEGVLLRFNESPILEL